MQVESLHGFHDGILGSNDLHGDFVPLRVFGRQFDFICVTLLINRIGIEGVKSTTYYISAMSGRTPILTWRCWKYSSVVNGVSP